MNNQEFNQNSIEKIKQLGEEVGFEMPLNGESDLPEFKKLREELKPILDVIIRRNANPTPDQEEISAGAYREEIEPQCREAIFTMRRKGYDTNSSGFAEGNLQTVDGAFYDNINQKTIDLLKENDFSVWRFKADGEWKVWSIVFRPQKADFQEITEKWNKLAEILPDLGHPAPAHTKSEAGFHKMFRAVHKGNTIDILFPKLYNYKQTPKKSTG